MCIQPFRPSYNPDVSFKCGRCSECVLGYTRSWIFRLRHELRFFENRAVFATLTYDWDSVPLTARGKFTLCKRDYQLFLKRLRKAILPRVIKFVLCGEYGTKNHRPHFHCLLFNITQDDYNVVSTCWGKGFVHFGTVTDASVAYTFKYATKDRFKTKLHRDADSIRPFVVMSKGLGEGHFFYRNSDNVLLAKPVLLAYLSNTTNFTLRNSASDYFGFPRYYLEKLDDLTKEDVRLRKKVVSEVYFHKKFLDFVAFPSYIPISLARPMLSSYHRDAIMADRRLLSFTTQFDLL